MNRNRESRPFGFVSLALAMAALAGCSSGTGDSGATAPGMSASGVAAATLVGTDPDAGVNGQQTQQPSAGAMTADPARSLKAAAVSTATMTQWINEQVALATSQPLNASQMNAWLSYFMTQTARTEADLRAEMLSIATRDAVTYGWPKPATYVRSADLIGQWVTAAVTSVSRQWLSTADFNAWVSQFMAMTSLTDDQIKAQMKAKALADAATYGWPLVSGVTAPAPSGTTPATTPAPAAVRTRDQIGQWVTAAVTSISKQWLSAADFRTWVDYFVTRTSLSDDQLKAEMRTKAIADAGTYGWPLLDGLTLAGLKASQTAPAPSTPAPAASSPAPSPVAKTPVATPPPAASAPATINTLQTVVDDMRLLVDAPLKNVNPSYGFSRGPGYVIQGNQPSGAHAPDWFLATYPWLRGDTTPWNYMIPWLVVFEGTANTGSNVRMHFRNLKTWVKTRSTAQWKLVVKADSLSGESCDQNSNFYQCSTTPPELRAEADGGMSTPYLSGKNFHGYWGGITYVQGDDIAAVLVTLQARLITNDPSGPDQTASAQFLMHTGADYYRDTNGSSLIYPAVGIGRAKLLGPQWKAFNMMTFSDVGIQEPGGGISEAEFRASPPPLD